MSKHVLRAVALGLAVASSGVVMSADPVAPIDVARMTVGQAPVGFSFGRTGKGEPGRWVVVDDAGAGAGRAIAQTSPDRTDYRFPLAIWDGLDAANVEATIRFKPVAGKVDEAGGIAIRLTSPNDYYVVRANALEDNVRFYRVVNGRREQIAGIDTKVKPGAWHSLGIRAEGNRFAISYDEAPAFTATDDTFKDAGKVALWTKADSVTHFDRIAVRALP
jgi:hypothetical protein